jgi:hypothetical protein
MSDIRNINAPMADDLLLSASALALPGNWLYAPDSMSEDTVGIMCKRLASEWAIFESNDRG